MSYSTFSAAPSTQPAGPPGYYDQPVYTCEPSYDSATRPLLSEPAYSCQPSAAGYPTAYATGAAYAGPTATTMYPPSGYPTAAGSVPSYYGEHTSYQQPITVEVCQPSTETIVIGGCPACRVGVLDDEFTCLGVLCAILFFPLGLVCCLTMTKKRCGSCGAVFD